MRKCPRDAESPLKWTHEQMLLEGSTTPTSSVAKSTGLPSGLKHSTVGPNETPSAPSHLAFLHPLTADLLWFEGGEHRGVSASGFHTASTASTRLTRAVAGSANPAERSVKVSAQERRGAASE